MRWATVAILLQTPHPALGGDAASVESGRVALRLATSLLARDVAASFAASATIADKAASEMLLLYADTVERQADHATLLALLSSPQAAALWREAVPREREHRLAAALAAASHWRAAFAQHAALLDADSDDWSAWMGALDATQRLDEQAASPATTSTSTTTSTTTTTTTAATTVFTPVLATTNLIDMSATPSGARCLATLVARARTLQRAAPPTRAPFLVEFELRRRASTDDSFRGDASARGVCVSARC